MSIDWTKSSAVVIPQVDAVAVYENEAEEITIRQKDSMGGDDVIISIPKSFIPDLIKALEKVISQK